MLTGTTAYQAGTLMVWVGKIKYTGSEHTVLVEGNLNVILQCIHKYVCIESPRRNPWNKMWFFFVPLLYVLLMWWIYVNFF